MYFNSELEEILKELLNDITESEHFLQDVLALY